MKTPNKEQMDGQSVTPKTQKITNYLEEEEGSGWVFLIEFMVKSKIDV